MFATSSRFPSAILFFLLPGILAGQQPDQKPLGIANGEIIARQDVEDAAAGDLQELEVRKARFEMELKRERHESLEKALETLIRGRVLAAEAARRKVSVDELLEIEVSSAVPQPTDEAVVQFYNANQAGLEGSLADNVAAIRAYLRDERRQAVLNAFVNNLKNDYGAESYIEPLRQSIAVDGHPFKGPVDAPVTIIEFSDFECPYCRALLPVLREIADDYSDKVRIVYFQFPLADIHKNALKAAEASLCAFEQNQFWPMHDALFADPANLDVPALKQKASILELDTAGFDACLDSGKHFETVRNDVTEGAKGGVTGTPALFINGRLLVGNQPYAAIQQIIEDELRRAGIR